MRRLSIFLSMLFFFFTANTASAVVFTSSGKIVRTLSDSQNYGQCMILMDSRINNGCPSSWLSLDCKGTHVSAKTGERNYATALMAASLGKKVVMQVDNNARQDTYCVVKRLDVLF